MMSEDYCITGACIVTPDKVIRNDGILISGKKIKKVGDINTKKIKIYNFKEKLIFPALFNAHDHLLGSYLPKVGNKRPYINWKPWDDELKSSPVYAERSKIPAEDIYLLGTYKNLISGVLTVSDHMPHNVNDPIIDKLNIRVLKDYALAHEVSSFDLKWGDGIDIEHKKAVEKNIPFITHIEEGFDSESMRGCEILEEHKALDRHTVMVHGISLSDEDIKLIAKRHANLVWCPNSNIFMFNRTAAIKKWLACGINVSLGTDSPMSGSLNILEELKFAKKYYRKMYKQDISDKQLVYMVTKNPAKAFILDKITGELKSGRMADILIIKGDTKKPYKALVNCKLKDISLVIYEGKPIYGDAEHKKIFDEMQVNYNEFLIAGKPKIMNGDPKGLMERVRNYVGFKKELDFLPVE